MTQVGIKGPMEIRYQEGYFVPVPHNLTISGGVTTYGGVYRVIGNVCFYMITVSAAVGQTTSSVAGTTYFTGLPFWLWHTNFSCHAGDTSTDLGFAGTGENCDDGAGGRAYPPTWNLIRFSRISGWFFLTA